MSDHDQVSSDFEDVEFRDGFSIRTLIGVVFVGFVMSWNPS